MPARGALILSPPVPQEHSQRPLASQYTCVELVRAGLACSHVHATQPRAAAATPPLSKAGSNPPRKSRARGPPRREPFHRATPTPLTAPRDRVTGRQPAPMSLKLTHSLWLVHQKWIWDPEDFLTQLGKRGWRGKQVQLRERDEVAHTTLGEPQQAGETTADT